MLDLRARLRETETSPRTHAARARARFESLTPASISSRKHRRAGDTDLDRASAIGRARREGAPTTTLRQARQIAVTRRADSALGATRRQGRDRLAFLAHRWMGGEPRVGEWEMPLRQTYSEEYLRVQYAFKVLMIH